MDIERWLEEVVTHKDNVEIKFQKSCRKAEFTKPMPMLKRF